MKKYKTIIGIIFLIILCLFFVKNYIVKYHGTALYFWRVSGEHSMGYVEAKKFANLSTDELLRIIEINKSYSKYPKTHYENSIMAGRYVGAITILGSKADPEALAELTKIICSNKEGDKWDVIGAIGKYKNKAMVPVLCEALKKHNDNNTDRLIVEALVNIDDSSALECLSAEKDKIRWADVRKQAEKAIEKWSKEKIQ